MSNDVLITINADDNASPKIANVTSSLSHLADIARTAVGVALGNVLTSAVSTATGAMSSMISTALESSAAFERMELAIGQMVKRELANAGQSLDQVGQRTQELIAWTRELAKESPFDSSDVTNALRMAMAFGFTSDEAKRLTQATLDYTAGAGLSAEAMERVMYALGQIKANSRLTGEEIMQLTDAGIAVREILAKELGVSIETLNKMVEAGKVNAEVAVEGIIKALEKDFGGAAAAQASSLSGLLSTLQELQQVALVETFRPAFEALKPLAEITITWLESDGLERLRQFGEYLASVTTNAVNLAVAFISSGGSVDVLYQALGQVSPQLEQIARVVGDVVGGAFAWLTSNADAVAAAIGGVTAAFLGMSAISAVAGIIAAVTNPLTLVAAAVGALAVAWQQNWFDIQTHTSNALAVILPVVTAIGDEIGRNLPALVEFFAGVWSTVWPVVVEWAQTAMSAIIVAGEAIANAVTAIGQVLSTVIPPVLDILKAAWSATWNGITTAVTAAGAVINAVISTFALAAEGRWYEFGATLRRYFDDAVRLITTAVTDLAGKVWNTLTGIDWAGIGASIVSSVQRITGSMITTFTSVDWGAVGRNIVDGIAKGISAGAGAIADAARSAASAALDAAKGFLGIQSPSRVFELQVGAQIAAGLARGIVRNVGMVEAASTVMATRSVTATTTINVDARGSTLAKSDIESAVSRALAAQRDDRRLRRL